MPVMQECYRYRDVGMAILIKKRLFVHYVISARCLVDAYSGYMSAIILFMFIGSECL